jgi:predicted house-cleaning noncanonical NTP pyrophosphatase (MazG superfamily)
MRKFTFNKLVRNKIPLMLKEAEVEAKCRTLSVGEYEEQLIKKLHEEVCELKEANFDETVEVDDDSKWMEYFTSNPKLFREIM